MLENIIVASVILFAISITLCTIVAKHALPHFGYRYNLLISKVDEKPAYYQSRVKVTDVCGTVYWLLVDNGFTELNLSLRSLVVRDFLHRQGFLCTRSVTIEIIRK